MIVDYEEQKRLIWALSKETKCPVVRCREVLVSVDWNLEKAKAICETRSFYQPLRKEYYEN